MFVPANLSVIVVMLSMVGACVSLVGLLHLVFHIVDSVRAYRMAMRHWIAVGRPWYTHKPL